MRRETEKPDGQLSASQEKAIAALLSCPTVRDAAEQSGVGESTLWRWLQLPAFEQLYKQARAGLITGARSRLEASAAAAVETLRAICEDRSAPATARIAAARAILSHVMRGELAAEVLEPHKHLCNLCQQEFNCTSTNGCAPFEWATCQGCKGAKASDRAH
jgi:hypothetical protein